MSDTQVPSKELCEHDWVGDDFCAYCDADAARDMLTDARLELDELRQALGVDYEPHQSLRERMLDAANHKRVERGVQGPCPNCGAKWASVELSPSHEPRDGLWNAYGNEGMRHMESADVSGGETDTEIIGDLDYLIGAYPQIGRGLERAKKEIQRLRAAQPPGPGEFKIGESVRVGPFHNGEYSNVMKITGAQYFCDYTYGPYSADLIVRATSTKSREQA